jgi:cell division protein FtsB
MDFQLKQISNIGSRIGKKLEELPSAEASLRVVAEKAPQAEALAVSWIERSRPVWAPIYALRRRIATIMVTGLAGLLFVHVMFGANGMVVYRQKRAEYQDLQRQVGQMTQENDRCTQQIEALKSDERAIEREAREQLHYARPGEFVYVVELPPSPAPPPTHSARK